MSQLSNSLKVQTETSNPVGF